MAVTVAVTWIGPMARLTLPARKSSVPQHRAASEPSRTGFIGLPSDAVGADQILARRLEMSRDEIGGGRWITHLERFEDGTMLLVIDVDLLLDEDDLLHLLPLCVVPDGIDMLVETVEQGIARTARQRQVQFRIKLGEEVLIAIRRFDSDQDAFDGVEVARRGVQRRKSGHRGFDRHSGFDELERRDEVG